MGRCEESTGAGLEELQEGTALSAQSHPRKGVMPPGTYTNKVLKVLLIGLVLRFYLRLGSPASASHRLGGQHHAGLLWVLSSIF